MIEKIEWTLAFLNINFWLRLLCFRFNKLAWFFQVDLFITLFHRR